MYGAPTNDRGNGVDRRSTTTPRRRWGALARRRVRLCTLSFLFVYVSEIHTVLKEWPVGPLCIKMFVNAAAGGAQFFISVGV